MPMDVAERSGAVKSGRYDIEVKPMRNGKGFIVLSALWAFDKIEMQIDEYKVTILENERTAKLIRDGKHFPLVFNCRKYFDTKKIARNLEQKLGYMQLGDTIDTSGFVEVFLEQCKEAEKRYKQNIDRVLKKD